MSNRRKSDDPRKLGGGIVGPGGPHDVGGVIVDTRNAILLDDLMVSTVDDVGSGRAAIAMQLSGRINRSPDRAKVLYLFGTDGAAGLITELLALMGRAGLDMEAFLADMDERLGKLIEEGNMKPRREET